MSNEYRIRSKLLWQSVEMSYNPLHLQTFLFIISYPSHIIEKPPALNVESLPFRDGGSEILMSWHSKWCSMLGFWNDVSSIALEF